ncbi:hypothetical protein [Streptomyces griseocarneus]|uniref:hypothetical protein n=1 Tax=Streptomyces griseocarneus TaxID=51201 RepID=UPI00167D0211|nr:hypothetical protein [Streptomyces griseocarneus]MBZ6476719.1 hypothetical protein [Streptomyces griseocarneus]GHG80526.1 hypothetical protein GCM10018779_62170 [Streptomyces griseocarneus]
MTDPFLTALEHATRTVVARARGEAPAAAPTTAMPTSDMISHTYCCDPDRALCGLDLSGMPPAGEGDQGCVVCVDLDECKAACPLCATDQSAA